MSSKTASTGNKKLSTKNAPKKSDAKIVKEAQETPQQTVDQPADHKVKATRKKAPESVEEQVAAIVATASPTQPIVANETQPASNGTSDTINVLLDELIERKKDEAKVIRADLQKLRDLKTAYNKQIRAMKNIKKNRVASKGGAHKNPSGFAQSTRIRDPLCEFLGLDSGSSIARTDVTRKVIRYIKDNELEEQENHRNIVPDSALEKLVGNAEERLRTMQARKAQLVELAERDPSNPKKQKKAQKCLVTDKLSYFNLQVHLNKQFIAEEKKKGQRTSAQTAHTAEHLAVAA